LVVDAQHGWCDPAGSTATAGVDVTPCAAAVEVAARLVAAARAHGVPVVHATTELAPGRPAPGSLGRLAAIGGLAPGSWDAEVVAPLRPGPGEPHVTKHRWNAFFGTPLDTILLDLAVEDLVIVGLRTNLSIQSTARDAAHREYRVTVVSDATADVDPEDHRLALESLGWAFATIAPSDEVLAGWGVRTADAEPTDVGAAVR
jgi:nicotinamidase-related amidase